MVDGCESRRCGWNPSRCTCIENALVSAAAPSGRIRCSLNDGRTLAAACPPASRLPRLQPPMKRGKRKQAEKNRVPAGKPQRRDRLHHLMPMCLGGLSNDSAAWTSWLRTCYCKYTILAISSVHRAEPLKPCRVHLEWNEGGASRRISRRKDRVTAREFADMASFCWTRPFFACCSLGRLSVCQAN